MFAQLVNPLLPPPLRGREGLFFLPFLRACRNPGGRSPCRQIPPAFYNAVFFLLTVAGPCRDTVGEAIETSIERNSFLGFHCVGDRLGMH